MEPTKTSCVLPIVTTFFNRFIEKQQQLSRRYKKSRLELGKTVGGLELRRRRGETVLYKHTGTRGESVEYPHVECTRSDDPPPFEQHLSSYRHPVLRGNGAYASCSSLGAAGGPQLCAAGVFSVSCVVFSRSLGTIQTPNSTPYAHFRLVHVRGRCLYFPRNKDARGARGAACVREESGQRRDMQEKRSLDQGMTHGGEVCRGLVRILLPYRLWGQLKSYSYVWHSLESMPCGRLGGEKGDTSRGADTDLHRAAAVVAAATPHEFTRDAPRGTNWFIRPKRRFSDVNCPPAFQPLSVVRTFLLPHYARTTSR